MVYLQHQCTIKLCCLTSHPPGHQPGSNTWFCGRTQIRNQEKASPPWSTARLQYLVLWKNTNQEPGKTHHNNTNIGVFAMTRGTTTTTTAIITTLFERKHAIHVAAVRPVLVDLRVPFGPGALDAAMEDLERAISTGDGGSSGRNIPSRAPPPPPLLPPGFISSPALQSTPLPSCFSLSLALSLASAIPPGGPLLVVSNIVLLLLLLLLLLP